MVVEDPLRAKLLALVTDPAYGGSLRQIQELDKDLATLVLAISSSKAKHSFLTSLANDPVTYITKWSSSQKRDLDVIMGEATRGGGGDVSSDEWRRDGKDSVWATSNAHESVQNMLAKIPMR